MGRFVLLAALAAGALALTAQTAVPVGGDRSCVDRLAGTWVGQGACEDTGRHGTVEFRLQAGAESAWATVLMTPHATDAVPAPAAVPLRVHAIEVTGRSFWGSLDRYDDPEWRLPLETEFGGALATDGRVEGYFRSEDTQAGTVRQCGRWWATRSADTP